MHAVCRTISQIPLCNWQISHNAPFCNRNVHTCTFLSQNVHCGIWDRCIAGFVQQSNLLNHFYPKYTRHSTVHSWGQWMHCLLVQDCSISIANALEILQSCTKQSMWYPVMIHCVIKKLHCIDIDAKTKWLHFCRWYFQIPFLKWNVLYFGSSFSESCSQKFN